ncbi:protein of unknown function [Kyrpidia spormannii]|uniref:Uncharacterized protein n=2 Tax=Kyrpidia spormannii TaxID=2055160 RepID=A0ACA8Z5P9_9BACL|nr:protein of unknown function [Kyrpidia spormannii]CAB3390473.1 protein of unknown function [Kyrpidia spormannii]
MHPLPISMPCTGGRVENYGLSKRRGVRCPPFEKLLIENVCVGWTFIRLEGIGRRMATELLGHPPTSCRIPCRNDCV